MRRVSIQWPGPPESYRALKQVRDRVRVPVSVGERLHTRWDFVPVFEEGLADFVMSAGRDLDRRISELKKDRLGGRGLLRSGLAPRRERAGQLRLRRLSAPVREGVR
ncbi:hypothetical protein GCM10022226_43450 [Sphaerisporangium flaviroseum]|uniref:Enolase C-terminal domain-containing protein n=1 Tax=Sphaerisporangium flaviroseum TaxID=509199 RepID=A0ABP7IGX3_9ACTN